MISRFSQLSLAFTTVTPLLLSVAIVLVIMNPSAYCDCWVGVINFRAIPEDFNWWAASILILVFFVSFLWTKWFLNRIERIRHGLITIRLSSLQYSPISSILQLFTILPPWGTLLLKNNLKIVLVLAVLLSLAITYAISKQGFGSLMFSLCGYRRFEGTNINGMKIQLLSRRNWKNTDDIRSVIVLNDNFALIVE